MKLTFCTNTLLFVPLRTQIHCAKEGLGGRRKKLRLGTDLVGLGRYPRTCHTQRGVPHVLFHEAGHLLRRGKVACCNCRRVVHSVNNVILTKARQTRRVISVYYSDHVVSTPAGGRQWDTPSTRDGQPPVLVKSPVHLRDNAGSQLSLRLIGTCCDQNRVRARLEQLTLADLFWGHSTLDTDLRVPCIIGGMCF